MSHDLTLEEMKTRWHGTGRAYIMGFIFSLLLTAIAYFFVWYNILPSSLLLMTILGLAIFQAIVQLFFFLHVGGELKPHWQTVVFLFMLLVLLIIVIGSLWIMHSLNSRMMPEMLSTL